MGPIGNASGIRGAACAGHPGLAGESPKLGKGVNISG